MKRCISTLAACLLAIGLCGFCADAVFAVPNNGVQPSGEDAATTEQAASDEEAASGDEASSDEKATSGEEAAEPEKKPSDADKNDKDTNKADADKKEADKKEADKKEADKKDKPDAEKKPAEEAKPPAPAGPPSVVVARGPLKIEVSLDGAFEAEKTAEISLEPEVWTSFKVLTAIEHGESVNKGDLLVSLDTEKIDRAIDDAKRDLASGEVALELAELEFSALEKTSKMDLTAAQREYEYAKHDLDYYFKVTRPMSIKSAEFMLKSAEQDLEYQREELRQLEKMYGADELTEETEEIILKRARNDLEYAEFRFERAKLYHDETLKIELPRRDVSMKESGPRNDLQWAQTKASAPLAKQQARMSHEKAVLAHQRAKENLDKLLGDRAAMTIKAPCSGIVYYGKASRGKFSGGSSDGALRPSSALTPKAVVMTIVPPRPVCIRSEVAEKDLNQVRPGIKGTAVPTGFPDMKLTAIVDRVGAIPMGAGSFDTRLAVALDDKAEAVMPGMTCKLTLVAYANENALTVPPKAVAEDEDTKKRYVLRVGKDGKTKKQYVTVGRRTDDKVEILKGLAEGDKIAAEAKAQPGKPKQGAAKKDEPKKDAPEKKTPEKKAPKKDAAEKDKASKEAPQKKAPAKKAEKES